MHQLAYAVDSSLIRNSERNDTHKRMLGELFIAMQKLPSELGHTRKNNIQIQEQIESVHQKLEGTNGKSKGKYIEVSAQS